MLVLIPADSGSGSLLLCGCLAAVVRVIASAASNGVLIAAGTHKNSMRYIRYAAWVCRTTALYCILAEFMRLDKRGVCIYARIINRCHFI